jgi:RNA polymerase sigma-70 factor, ECF subfamily
VEDGPASDPELSERAPGTLGEVLYSNSGRPLVAEQEWVALVRAIAEGDETALHELYERSHRPVYTLIMRITANRETTEEVTLDVFHDVWRRASRYDPADGTVLGWIMNQARSRAIDRLRFEHRKKRVATTGMEPGEMVVAADAHDLVAFEQQRESLRAALVSLTPHEREAIETAFFAELSYAEVATRLDVPLGTIKTRIRSGLQKLRKVLDT